MRNLLWKSPILKIFSILLFPLILSQGSFLFPQESFRKSPPYPDPLPELNLPKIESFFLSNGLGLSVIRRKNLPIINLNLIILTGESFSPEDLPGIATFTANMLSKGSINLSSSKIEEIIESIGGTFSSFTYPDFTVFNFSFLDDYLDEALDVLSRMILQPAFSRQEIENAKRSMFYELRNNNLDAEFLARRLLFRLLFKDYPYKKALYNNDIIKKYDRKRLLNFFNKYYIPNNSRIILTGNLNLSTASRKVSRYLNTWRKKEIKSLFLEQPSPCEKTKICFSDLPNAKYATIYLGNIISPSTSDDFFPFLVLNQVLGGGPNSRLFMNLRESKGFAYYAFSRVEFFKYCGVFYVQARVRPEVITESIEEILGEIQKITKEKTTIEEIEQAKSYLIGNFPLQIETFDKFSFKFSKARAFNLGERQWNKYYENIMRVNSEKVFDTVKKNHLLSPVIIIVADRSALDHLINLEEVEVYNNKGILQYIIRKENNNETR